MNVLYNNRTQLPADKEKALNARHVSQEELLHASDFVVVMVPYSKDTHHLIGEKELSMMKPTAIFINTARGGVADDAALIRVLKAKKIAGAGIDVFENEPAFHREFLDLENVVLTPHIGSATYATRLNMAKLAAKNLSMALRGEAPVNWVNG
jgi:glyoxylate/hydroxypyruvate/2-ketogluconate reductase